MKGKQSLSLSKKPISVSNRAWRRVEMTFPKEPNDVYIGGQEGIVHFPRSLKGMYTTQSLTRGI